MFVARHLVYSLDDTFRYVWLFLTVVQWRVHGLDDGDAGLVEFARRMAELYNISDLLSNWGNSNYVRAHLESNHRSIEQDMRELLEKIRRRQPEASHQTGSDDTGTQTPMAADDNHGEQHFAFFFSDQTTTSSGLDNVTISTGDIDYGWESSSPESTLFPESWESLSSPSEGSEF